MRDEEMEKWKLGVCGLLCSLLLGIVFLASSQVDAAAIMEEEAETYAASKSGGSVRPAVQFALKTSGAVKTVSGNSTDAGRDLTPETTTSNQALDDSTIKSLTNSDRKYTSYKLDIKLKSNSSDVSLSATEAIELEFTVPNVTSSSDVRILHYEGSSWEASSASVVSKGANTVKARFTKLSPIAILVYNAPAAPTGGGGGEDTDAGSADDGAAASAPAPDNAAAGQQSPKTYDGSMILFAEGAAAFALLGFVAFRKKSRMK